MTDRRAVLLELAQAVAPDQSVTVPAAWLLDALAEADPAPLGDLTVPNLCQRYGRRGSCVRAWLEAGRFPGAYKLLGKEWRVPSEAVRAFEVAQQGKTAVRRGSADLSSWRKVRKPAA